MARKEYKIGNFDFLTIDGVPMPPQELLALDQRHGVDGTEITRLGKKGEPFQLQTTRDYATYGTCFEFLKNYLDMIGDGPKDLLLADQDVSAFGYRVNVLKVRSIRITRVAASVGGLVAGPPAEGVMIGYMVCLWDLIATEVV